MSIPFSGKEFTFTQPDGTALRVRGWGDQYHAVFETLNGYTVVEDPATGFYQYADVSADGDDLIPTGARPRLVNPQNLGLKPGNRVSRAAAKAKAVERPGLPRGNSRWEQRRRQFKQILRERSGRSRRSARPTSPRDCRRLRGSLPSGGVP